MTEKIYDVAYNLARQPIRRNNGILPCGRFRRQSRCVLIEGAA